MKHIISVLVENRFGVLAHVSGLFSARGFNIDSLAVGETEDPTISRMTIVVDGDERILEQVTKQLHKLIDVVKVQDLTKEDFIDRELTLIRVNAQGSKRSEIMEIVDIFRARIVDVNPKSVPVERTGDQEKSHAILELLRPYGIIEIARTGRSAMSR
jgi:acetolactate synthase-1/3 small subunit